PSPKTTSVSSSSMTAADIIRSLRAAGAIVAMDGDRLQIDAPRGVVTGDLQAAIRALKLDILLELRRERDESQTPLPDAGDDERFPLATAQERIWLFQQLQPESAAYLLTQILRIEGPFDLARLESSIRAVVERHEALRCVVTTENGEAQ